jgi:hypothetical protein
MFTLTPHFTHFNKPAKQKHKTSTSLATVEKTNHLSMIFMNDSYTEITNRNLGEGINRGDHLTTCGVENIMEKKILLPKHDIQVY